MDNLITGWDEIKTELQKAVDEGKKAIFNGHGYVVLTDAAMFELKWEIAQLKKDLILNHSIKYFRSPIDTINQINYIITTLIS